MGHLFRPGNTSGIGFSHSLSTFVIIGAPNIDWRSVAWSPTLGLFCAVGQDVAVGNAVMTSPDGIVWTQQNTAPVNVVQVWRGICWADGLGLFVAVGGGTDRVMTSPDGINWTPQVAASADTYESVVWASGLGLLVAVSSTGAANSVMTSPDGIAWTIQVTPFTGAQAWSGIAYSPQMGTLCAVSPSGGITIPGFLGRAMTSVNGVNWFMRDIPVGTGGPGPVKLAWSPKLGMFAAIKAPAGVVYDNVVTSPDGISWTQQNVPATAAIEAWTDIAWSPDQEMFAAVSNGATLFKRLLTSLDGVNWHYNVSAVNTTTDNNWSGLAWSPALDMFAMVARSAGSTNFAATAIAP
jgi:hypothetical protein